MRFALRIPAKVTLRALLITLFGQFLEGIFSETCIAQVATILTPAGAQRSWWRRFFGFSSSA